MTSGGARTGPALIVYALYLVGLFIPLTALIGLIVAYVNRGEGPAWLEAHYDKQIGMFWLGLLVVIVGGLLTFVLIGYLVLLIWAVWVIWRCVVGIKRLNAGQPG